MHSKGLKGQTINSYLSAVKSLHLFQGYEYPCKTLLLASSIKGAQVLSTPVSRKLPVTFDILQELFDASEVRNDSLMLKSVMTTLFFGCMRSGEICLKDDAVFDQNIHLCLADICFNEQEKYFTLLVKRSKTDKFNTGVKIFIGCSGHKVCAYCSTKKYIASIKSSSKHSPLFVHHGCKPLRRSYFIDAVRALLTLQHYDANNFSGHSFRAGSATMASFKSFKDWEIKLLGRWQSEVYNIYLRKRELVASFAPRLVT